MESVWKRLIPLAIAFLALQFIPFQPSHAIFGLSKCEKAWKQVNTQESLVTYFQRTYPKGNELTIPVGSLGELKVESVFSAISEIWKVGTNYPKCFSNTQKLIIKQMKTRDFYDSVLQYHHITMKNFKYKSSTTYIVGNYVALASR